MQALAFNYGIAVSKAMGHRFEFIHYPKWHLITHPVSYIMNIAGTC
jgi:hypothetical protein